tara:strand:- start:9181 stop:10191 length:1011 start_codon:yes stop_codon:yes gene_type:complete
MNLVYSCVFHQENYIQLISVLLKSYRLYGNEKTNVKYLVITSKYFKEDIQNIFDELDIFGELWLMENNTIFESAYSRLKIFKYPDINKYETILYLDCDILITNDIQNIFSLTLSDKLYVLQENFHRTNHCYFFNDDELNNLPPDSTFTSGIILFKNTVTIKNFFNEILKHINIHLKNNEKIPFCLEQPFIIYHSIIKNMYDNKLLIGTVVNNPDKLNGETICHFPTSPGHYKSKIYLMYNFIVNVLFEEKKTKTNTTKIIGNVYTWNNSNIQFLTNGNMNAFGVGKYYFITKTLIKAKFGNQEHLIKFNYNFTKFFSVRKADLNLVKGHILTFDKL